jgi:hypothetical protein
MGRVHSSCLNTRIATGVWLRTTGLIGGLWPCIELKALLSMAWKSQPKRLRSKRKKAHIYAIGNGSMRSTRPKRKYPDRVSCVELTVRANFMMPVATPRCNSTLSAPKIQHALRTGAERLGKRPSTGPSTKPYAMCSVVRTTRARSNGPVWIRAASIVLTIPGHGAYVIARFSFCRCRRVVSFA